MNKDVLNFTDKIANVLYNAHEEKDKDGKDNVNDGVNINSQSLKEEISDQYHLPVTQYQEIYCPIIKEPCKGNQCMFFDIIGIDVTRHSIGSCLFTGLNISLRAIVEHLYDKKDKETVVVNNLNTSVCESL